MAKTKKRSTSKRPKAKKPTKSATRKPKGASSGGGPTRKQAFLELYAREHATTLKVLRAFPPGQAEFRPHPRSQSLGELMYTLIVEQELKRRALAGGPLWGGGTMPPKPTSVEQGIEQFDKGYQSIFHQIRTIPDEKLNVIVQFPTGPGQMGDWNALDFIWFMLHDQIHHRGQLTVMLRMSGGKVPSIYGPSGDEPWR